MSSVSLTLPPVERTTSDTAILQRATTCMGACLELPNIMGCPMEPRASIKGPQYYLLTILMSAKLWLKSHCLSFQVKRGRPLNLLHGSHPQPQWSPVNKRKACFTLGPSRSLCLELSACHGTLRKPKRCSTENTSTQR